jgi:putative SOS response-associated peptidase YedK
MVVVLRICRHQATQETDWFVIDETRPLASFAGIWTEWEGRRGTKANPIEGKHTLCGAHREERFER